MLVTLAADQVSKWVAAEVGMRVDINPGVSFRLFAGASPAVLMFLAVMTIVVLAVGLRDIWQKHPAAAGLFFGGAVSNLLDRVWFGGVRDWLPLPLTGIHNNLADYAVVLSLLFVAYQLVFNSSYTANHEKKI